MASCFHGVGHSEAETSWWRGLEVLSCSPHGIQEEMKEEKNQTRRSEGQDIVPKIILLQPAPFR